MKNCLGNLVSLTDGCWAACIVGERRGGLYVSRGLLYSSLLLSEIDPWMVVLLHFLEEIVPLDDDFFAVEREA